MKIGIIGAGASGMMAAVTAAAYGACVVLLEKNDRVGKKILATGNGKCNLSNLDFHMGHYYCEDKERLQKLFEMFSVQDLLAFLEKNGVMVREKNGYLYPYSEQASTILEMFRRLLKHKLIQVETECEVKEACYQEKTGRFIVKTTDRQYEFDKLIVACGGPASQKRDVGMTGFQIAKAFGHRVHKVVPGLVQLRGSDSFLKGMAGVRAKAKAVLLINDKAAAEEQGEVQFTEYGISGIPVLQFSRLAAYALAEEKDVQVKINLFPDYDKERFAEMLQYRYESMQEASLEEFLNGTVNKKINASLMKYRGLKPDIKICQLSFAKICKLMQLYCELTVHITAVNGMENAQVCAGGVDLKQLSMEMESLKCAGLYFVGEVVDVDGKCGGYNLQWAFTGGYIAGKSAAGGLTERA